VQFQLGVDFFPQTRFGVSFVSAVQELLAHTVQQILAVQLSFFVGLLLLNTLPAALVALPVIVSLVEKPSLLLHATSINYTYKLVHKN